MMIAVLQVSMSVAVSPEWLPCEGVHKARCDTYTSNVSVGSAAKARGEPTTRAVASLGGTPGCLVNQAIPMRTA